MQATTVKTAITTTARNFDPAFLTWSKYHLALVDHIFLWVDDPAEWESAYILRDPRITVNIGCQDRSKTTHGMLMHRQNVNVDCAVLKCLSNGIDWLLHIDSDELLFTRGRASLSALWESLAPSGFGQIIFPNHEVCPRWTADNVFRECVYFKLNGRCAFNLYINGKAAVRVNADIRANGPHRFRGYSGQHGITQSAVVLHYACATYDLWLKKYEMLGDFSNSWYDDHEAPITLPFHLASRNVYRACRLAGNYERAKAFFAKTVPNNELIETLLINRIVGRFEPLSEIPL